MDRRTDIIDTLSKDWLERDGKTFVKIRQTGRLGWEKLLKENAPYSSFILSSPTMEELIKRAYPLAKQTISAMDTPFKVDVRLSDKESFTNSKEVFVSTAHFDDDTLDPGQKLDIFLGLTVHEASHLLYTGFSCIGKANAVHPLCGAILNIIEDERIERETGEEKPGLANYLAALKDYSFGRYASGEKPRMDEGLNPITRAVNALLGYVRYPKMLTEDEMIEFGDILLRSKEVLTPYPKNTEEALKAAQEIFKILEEELTSDEGDGEGFGSDESESGSEDRKKPESKPESPEKSDSPEESGKEDGPESSEDGTGKDGSSEGESEEEDADGSSAGTEESGEPESSEDGTGKDGSSEGESEEEDADGSSAGTEESGEPESSEDGTEGSHEKVSKRRFRELSAKTAKEIRKIADSPIQPKEEGARRLSSDDMAKEVKMDGKLLADICEGRVELGSSKDIRFYKMHGKKLEYKERYKKALAEVKRYIPAVAKAVKGRNRDQAVCHMGMRSGLLDTNKLAEAIQDVQTVYKRRGEIVSDRATVCILVDESGSMSRNGRYLAARNTAVLLNEALGNLPKVDLYIYGHSADEGDRYADTVLRVYREKGFKPQFALGEISARDENRDGVAILETARRVRKFTDEEVIMIVISDGTPAASGYSGMSAIEHTKNAVLEVEKMGFHVMQVCINACYDPGLMFKRHIKLENMNTLAADMGKMISKMLSSSMKSRVAMY